MARHIQKRPVVNHDKPKVRAEAQEVANDIEAYLKAGGKITMLEYAGDEKSRHEAMQSISLV